MFWTQEDIAVKNRKSFPEEWLVGVPIPFLQDILSSSPFTDFGAWIQMRGENLPIGSTLEGAATGRAQAALGRQAGVLDSKRALPAVIGYGIGKEQHFDKCRQFGAAGQLPFDADYAPPIDLRFAAFATVALTVAGEGRLRRWRQAGAGSLKELSQRLQPLSRALRRWQSHSVHAVAKNVHVALICVLTWVMGWPDWRLAQRFITGFDIIGRLEETGIWKRCESQEPISEGQLLMESSVMLQGMTSRRPDVEATFLWESCLKEHEKGWAAAPVSKAVLDRKFGARGWAAVPSFVHVQQSGKKRRIDNAKAGGQNDATAYPERWHMPSAFTPAIYAKALAKEASDAGVSWHRFALEMGGEDLPDAYRSLPVRPKHLRYNIIAAREPRSGQWRFLEAYALLFGLSSSVMDFMRWSTFLEAAARRVLALLHTMYVDDGGIGDMSAAKGAGQAALNILFEELGTPCAGAKQQRMSHAGTFLGIEHDVTHAFDERGVVEFSPREQMIAKVMGLIQSARSRNHMTPAEASKLRGILPWMGSSMFNGIGVAAMAPLKQRQYSDVAPWALSHNIRRSLDYLEFILELKPRRLIHVSPDTNPLIVVASDARADGSGLPSGGYLLIDCGTGERVGGWCHFDDALLAMWGFPVEHRRNGGNPIALCEGAMVPIVMEQQARRLQDRRVLWILDNTSALHSFVKGRCEHATLDRSVNLMNFFKAGACDA